MAFSRSPMQTTYSTERVPITRLMDSRAGSTYAKDESFVNVFIEPIYKDPMQARMAQDMRKFIMKRSGSTQLVASVAATPIRGMWFWEDQQKLYYCVGRNVYVYDVNANTSTTLTNTFTTTSGVVGFTEFLFDDNSTVIIATDGTTLVKIDTSNVVTPCTDPDLPAHLPYPVFLDGYIFVVKTSSGDIYNSDLNNPISWTAGNFITAEMEPDLLIRIAKVNNYLVAFGKESAEYFWDAANASGSPLQRNDTPVKINTYMAGLAQCGNELYYIGKDKQGQLDVFTMKDFQQAPIGSPVLTRYLNVQTDGINNWYGNIVSFMGHTFYVITAGTTQTFVLDLQTKLWSTWAWQGGLGTTFPIAYATTITTTSSYRPIFCFTGNDSTIYIFKDDLYQDNGTNFSCIVVTEASDFETLNRKTMRRLSIVGDRPPVNSNITIQWSDDDYQTYNTGQTTNLNQDLPCIYNLGSFRQRNFKLTHTDNTLLRIQELEVEINKGTS